MSSEATLPRVHMLTRLANHDWKEHRMACVWSGGVEWSDTSFAQKKHSHHYCTVPIEAFDALHIPQSLLTIREWCGERSDVWVWVACCMCGWCVDVLMCWLCWCVEVLTLLMCVDVLMCWCVDVLMCWMCWCADDCVDVLICWCVGCVWCVDVLMMCWCVDVLMRMCWCVDVLMCWCVGCVDVLDVLMCWMCWCVDVLMIVLMCWYVDVMCWMCWCVDVLDVLMCLLMCWLHWYVDVLRCWGVEVLRCRCWGIDVDVVIYSCYALIYQSESRIVIWVCLWFYLYLKGMVQFKSMWNERREMLVNGWSEKPWEFLKDRNSYVSHLTYVVCRERHQHLNTWTH